MRIEFNKFIQLNMIDFLINEIEDNSDTNNSLMLGYFVEITLFLN